MSRNSTESSGQAPGHVADLEESLMGSTYRIKGYVGGYVRAFASTGCVSTDGSFVPGNHLANEFFVIEQSPVANDAGNPMVTFRLQGTTQFYLTQNPFGDAAQAQLLETLIDLQWDKALPPEVLRQIVQYAVATGSSDSNFEGAGFDYTPMKAVEGPPGLLQSFNLEGNIHRMAIRSPFGKYWRSQYWNNTVSQSSHWLRDETWTFRIQES